MVSKVNQSKVDYEDWYELEVDLSWLQRWKVDENPVADPARTGQEMMRPVVSPGYAAPEVIAVMPQRYNEKVPRSARACAVSLGEIWESEQNNLENMWAIHESWSVSNTHWSLHKYMQYMFIHTYICGCILDIDIWRLDFNGWNPSNVAFCGNL